MGELLVAVLTEVREGQDNDRQPWRNGRLGDRRGTIAAGRSPTAMQTTPVTVEATRSGF